MKRVTGFLTLLLGRIFAEGCMKVASAVMVLGMREGFAGSAFTSVFQSVPSVFSLVL
jgi:hypothetical protein